MYEVALEWIAGVLIGDAAEDKASPAAVLVLLNEYVRTGRAEVAAAAERTIALGIAAAPHESDACLRIEWLGAFRQTAFFSNETALAQLVEQALAGAVDSLEQLVRRTYQPGEGLGGDAADELRVSSALLTAFELTGRLPYPMLAEELFHASRRRLWQPAQQRYGNDFSVNADAVRIGCRLEALRRDEEYRARAVVAPANAAFGDYEAIVEWLDRHGREHADSAASFGMALINWLALRALPN